MKRCPKCNRTYPDDAQKFCTHDGDMLVADVQPTVTFDPNATIITETPPPPQQDSPPTMPVRPPAQDFNKTIASTMPPSPPPPTTDFHSAPTGPTTRPTSANLPPPPSSQGPSQAQTPTAQTSPSHAQQTQAAAASSSTTWPPQPQNPARPATADLNRAQTQVGVQPSPPQPPRKKSKLPWILGGLAVLLLLLLGGGAALYFFVMPRVLATMNTNSGGAANRNANQSASPAENTNAAANANANAAANANESASSGANSNASPETASETSHTVAPFVPPPNATAFVNSNAKLDGKLAEHYVDFSFYYPRTWKLDQKSGVAGASNFVKVERLLPPDYTQEQFAVSWYESGGTMEADRDKLAKLVEAQNSKYQQFPEYRKVSEGDTKINSYDGYEFRFESISRNTAKGDIKLWGRIVFLPPGVAGEKNGVILLMLATSLAPELSSVSDVGVKGEMPLILDSFRFGKTQ